MLADIFETFRNIAILKDLEKFIITNYGVFPSY